MNKEQKLRRCPFCGGEAVLDEFENDHIIGWFGRCLECNASMPYAISKPIAVKQWNRRSSDEQAEVVGWVDWHGGECPVAPDATVEAKLRHGGPTHVARASGLSWKHGNIHGPTMDSDIVSYRVLASPPAVAAGGVTDQAVEAACKAFYGEAAWQFPRGIISKPSSIIAMRRALTAALREGRDHG